MPLRREPEWQLPPKVLLLLELLLLVCSPVWLCSRAATGLAAAVAATIIVARCVVIVALIPSGSLSASEGGGAVWTETGSPDSSVCPKSSLVGRPRKAPKSVHAPACIHDVSRTS